MALTKYALPHHGIRGGARRQPLFRRRHPLGLHRGGYAGLSRLPRAGLNALTVSLDRTYGDDGLIVNSADPGWVATEMGGAEAP